MVRTNANWQDPQLTQLEKDILKGQSSQLTYAYLPAGDQARLQAVLQRGNWLAGLDSADVSPEEIFLLHQAGDVSLEWYRLRIEDSNCPYNTYPGLFGDSLVCYLIPSPDSGNIYFGGGIKLTLNKKNLEVLDDARMHQEIACLSKGDAGETVFRSIEPDTMLNEVDIAQCIWYRHYATVQYLTSSKYWFCIRTDTVITKDHIQVYDTPQE